MLKYKSYILLLLFITALTFYKIIDIDRIKSLLFNNKNYKYTLEYKKNKIKEINLIYIGSSRCNFSNNNDLYKSVDQIKDRLKSLSKEHEVGFSSLGIAAEWNTINGINHLEKFGPFDEIITGNSWNNTGILKYIGEMGEEPSTPQIIITFKTYTESIKFKLNNEKGIARFIGIDQILNWLENGTPLPQKFMNEIS